MTSSATRSDSGSQGDPQLAREVLGYLNFSNGTPDPSFAHRFNQLWTSFQGTGGPEGFVQFLLSELAQLAKENEAFQDGSQAESVLRLTFDEIIPAYRAFHSDLLFHVPDTRFFEPFFLVRIIEIVLGQGPPWNDSEHIVGRTLERLNDFLGCRPIPILENGLRSEPYEHERFRPIPLYIRGAGVAAGPYSTLIQRTLDFFARTPVDVMREAYFDYERVDEIALDVRAHDHTHPVNKRTNYMFGEWDPHVIDTSGFYRRFIIRQMILDALMSWMEASQHIPEEERYYDASAVLCGTMLMASAISGSGPGTHDSSVTLTSLLPKVARQRDMFYSRLLSEAQGDRRQRLTEEAALTQQPFGHVRQHLNMYLARYGARQVQHRQLATLYARMGYSAAAREEAAIIPSASGRFETEIQWRLTGAKIELERSNLELGSQLINEVQDLFERGISCGALVDPWNVLGFQAQFPLFTAREDSVPDHRVDALLDLKEQSFAAYSQAMCVAAAQGATEQVSKLSEMFLSTAEKWDRYATPTVEDLQKVFGRESWESATLVSQALAQWQAAGEAAGDIQFWAGHVAQFQSAKAYAQVVDALLKTGDHIATMGLLMQWLSQWEDVGLESGGYSIHAMLVRWMRMVVGAGDLEGLPASDQWVALKRLFAYLESNAERLWSAPDIRQIAAGIEGDPDTAPSEIVEDPLNDDDDEDDDDADIFGAAYDGVTYTDSADDGVQGETLDSGLYPGNTEFEILNRQLEPRLRFLMTVGHLWQMAAVSVVSWDDAPEQSDRNETVEEWYRQARCLKQELMRLLNETWDYEIAAEPGDLDANVEYDVQLQTKYYMMHSTIATYLGCEVAERTLAGLLPADRIETAVTEEEAEVVAVYRGVLQRDVESVRETLPRLLDRISHHPLLYVPFDNGGSPERVLKARGLQTLIRFLLEQLPRLGMLTQTFELLKTAYRMERSSRPAGLAVTEFDRLFRTALRNSLQSVIASYQDWDGVDGNDEELVNLVERIVEAYRKQWLLHSKTMRLSTVEELQDEELAESARDFIEAYGADLFHARHLTLGNIRAILHNGVDQYLDYLEKNSDPLHPVALIEDLKDQALSDEDAVEYLELIYEIVVDKFDRFLEYNTTTTQSDYGERFYALLDFLQVEAGYDRDSWELAPFRIAHQVLANSERPHAAMIWEERVAQETAARAEMHVERLRKLETSYGMQLPSVADHLNERFVKPLAVNRMSALVSPSCKDAVSGELPSEAFEELRREINEYQADCGGAGIDVPPWLRNLEKELTHHEDSDVVSDREAELPVSLPPVSLTREQLDEELANWTSTTKRKKTRRRRGSEQ